MIYALILFFFYHINNQILINQTLDVECSKTVYRDNSGQKWKINVSHKWKPNPRDCLTDSKPSKASAL